MEVKNIVNRSLLAVLVAGASSSIAHAEETPFTFITNWYAQAEHGGFYQAKEQGLYKQQGLDVTIKMGGPQVNNTQLLVAGKADCIITDVIGVMMSQKRGLPIQLVGTSFQYDPTVVITHADVKNLGDLNEDNTILISTSSHSSWWPWAKKQFGFTDAMTRPYTFNVQPFVMNDKVAQQGFMTSEPFALEKTGVSFNVYSIGQEGYPSYGNSLACSNNVIEEHPEKVKAFLQASMSGWKSYLNDPSLGNKAIKLANPSMADDQIAYSVEKLRTSEIVTGGDAETKGIGIITPERMEKTWQMAVSNGLFAAEDVNLEEVYTTAFINDVKVTP